MKIKAVINEKYEEMELHVCHASMNERVADMVSSLDEFLNQSFSVRKENGDMIVISSSDILSVFAQNQHVYVKTVQGLCETQLSLSALEEKLDRGQFFRISRSEIINLKKIRKLDMGMTGTIKVILSDGSESYTSRRNVTSLKRALGI